MSSKQRFSANILLPAKKTSLLILLMVICAASQCGKNENTPSGINPDLSVENNGSSSTADSGDYMNKSTWNLAKAELKTINEIINTFNDFYNIWGWAYEHRTFYRYKEALETVDYIPGKLDEIMKLAGSIKSVPGYPEIDSMKQCYLNMIALFRTGAQNFKESIIAARDKNEAEERRLISLYTADWKKAMEFSKKTFAIMPEVLTRGSRTEYQNLAGESKTTTASAASFRVVVRRIVARYDSSIVKEISVIKKLAANSQWNVALVKTDDVASRLQSSIMEAGQAQPGDRKELWDTRQDLVAMLSHQMMAMNKFREYAEKTESGDLSGAEQSKKIYEILRKSADEARGRLKKTGY